MNNQQPTIALLHWGDRIEDFLDSIGISFEAFCDEMTGGWLFGYIDALQQAGMRVVLFCISTQVSEPVRYCHKATGATICVLPIPKLHHRIRQTMKNPYGWTLEEVFGKTSRIRHPLNALLRDISFYLANPLGLLAHEIKRENCQVILCQEYEYARFDVCVLLGKWLNIPVFATFQGGNFQLSRLEHYLRPLTIRACAGLIIASQDEIQRVQAEYGVPSHKIAKIFNPMDVADWQPFDRLQSRQALGLSPDAEILVYHGRIEIYRKGLDVLMDAWEKVCQARPQRNLNLLFVGTGSGSAELHQMIRTRSITNVIWVDEYVCDRTLLRQYLSAADCYVLPSRNEGFPVAPIEAMACGLPIVATDAPGVPDILEDGENSGGILVPRDNPDAMAAAIGRLLDDSTLRLQMGERARYRAEQAFSLEAIGQQLKTFLLKSA